MFILTNQIEIMASHIDPKLMAIAVISMFATVSIIGVHVRAAEIWTCDSTGAYIDGFYDNETVYLTSNDITDGTPKEIYVYIVTDNNTWENSSSLIDVSGGYKVITTNSSGQISLMELWGTPIPGKYDIVANVNKTGRYHSTFDFVNSLTGTGIEIEETSIPKLIIQEGKNSPESRDWDVSDGGKNEMIQVNITAGGTQNVKLQSISIRALGTGDDGKDVTAVTMILDGNANGMYDTGEYIMGFGSFMTDNGIIVFEIDNGHVITANGSIMLLIIYEMEGGEPGYTYSFEMVSADAQGTATGEDTEIIGLPLGSAITTIASTVPVTSTTIPTDECQNADDCGGVSCENKIKTMYTCELDSNKGVNVCAPILDSVSCCGDADCVDDYYCSNYKCITQIQGTSVVSDIQNLISGNFMWIGGSIIVVLSAAAIIFVSIKNKKKTKYPKVEMRPKAEKKTLKDLFPWRKKKLFHDKRDPWIKHPPWKESREVERDWEELMKKWKNESGKDE